MLSVENLAPAIAQLENATLPSNAIRFNQHDGRRSPSATFVIKTETSNGNDWDGVGVQLWREIAEDLNIQYEWREVATDEEIGRLQSGDVDVVVGAIATLEGERQIDFTQSYYVSSLGVAQPRQRKILDTIGAVLSPRFWKTCLWLSLLLLAVGAVVWLFERSQNDDMYATSLGQGLWDSFWWAGRHAHYDWLWRQSADYDWWPHCSDAVDVGCNWLNFYAHGHDYLGVCAGHDWRAF